MSVINDVINNVKDDFSEEGVEEQVLQELKKVGLFLSLLSYLYNVYLPSE